MTNAELIAKLQEFPPDAPVHFLCEDETYNGPTSKLTFVNYPYALEDVCGELLLTFVLEDGDTIARR